MKVIEIRTYRIQYDTGSDRAFRLGLEAAKAGFTHVTHSICDSEHIYLSKEKLNIDLHDKIHTFQTNEEIPSCTKETDLLDGENYLTSPLGYLLDEVFYEDNSEITLPSISTILKISNHNSY